MSYEPEAYGEDRSQAASRTNAPGILLIVVGILNVLGGIYFIVNGAITLANPEAAIQAMELFNPGGAADMDKHGISVEGMTHGVAIGYLVLGAVAVLAAILTILGGVKMRGLQSYSLAMFGSVLALIPCLSPTGCCLLGEIAGIWAIYVLMNPEVKAAFHQLSGPPASEF